jgi:potassium channel subfamily K
MKDEPPVEPPLESPTEERADEKSRWERIKIHFNLRPPEDEEPQSWWIASTAIPLIAATTGPMANVMSVVALVQPWRSDIISKDEGPGGNYLQEGYPDPRW